MTKLWKDSTGRIVHIGQWDYQIQYKAVFAEGGEVIPAFTAFGGETKAREMIKVVVRASRRRPSKIVMKPGRAIEAMPGEKVLTRVAIAGDVIGYAETITNPVPDDVSQHEGEIGTADDGGLFAVSDYAGFRRVAYPSLADQLDAFWKGGKAADEMRKRVLAVKTAYPKN